MIDVDTAGSIQGEIDALNRLIELTVPPVPWVWREGGTYVIPGHGRICEQSDVVEYRDMVTIIRDIIQDMIKRGMTLEQVQGGRSHQALLSVRIENRSVDHGHVRRGSLQEPHGERNSA